MPRTRVNGISEIRTVFRTNTQPVYVFGPTAFNLLGIVRLVPTSSTWTFALFGAALPASSIASLST